MRKSKSNSTLRARPKSAGILRSSLSKSKSKSTLTKNGSQTSRARIIPWVPRKRHPRIDDGIRLRYPEWRITARGDDVYGLMKRSPGPIYIPKDTFVLPQQPKWTLGRLIDDSLKNKKSPGPIYNPKYTYTHYDAPKFSMIKRRPERTFAHTTPAPNQYDPTKSKYYKSSRQYTLKGRITKRTDTLSDTPGPSAYDVSKSVRKHSIPSTKISSRLPDMTQKYLNSVPGPAAYIPQYDKTLHRSSKWTMGSRNKIIDSRCDNPGPGYYGPSLVPPYKRKKKKRKSKR